MIKKIEPENESPQEEEITIITQNQKAAEPLYITEPISGRDIAPALRADVREVPLDSIVPASLTDERTTVPIQIEPQEEMLCQPDQPEADSDSCPD